MPSFAKFVKDFLNKKMKYKDEEIVEVQGNYNTIIQKTLSLKFKYPRSFTISCTIGEQHIKKVLIVLGASINLMPLFVLKKIGGLNVKPTRMIDEVIIDVDGGKLKVRSQDGEVTVNVFEAEKIVQDFSSQFDNKNKEISMQGMVNELH